MILPASFHHCCESLGDSPAHRAGESDLYPCRLILQNGQSEAVVVTCVNIADLRLGLLQLRLAEFDDRTQPQPVAGLGKIEGEVGLLEQLLGYGEAIIGGLGIEPTVTHVAGDAGHEVAQSFLRGLSPQRGFACPRAEEKAIEDRNVHVYANRAVPTGNNWIADRRIANGAERPDVGKEQVAFRLLKFLRRLGLEFERRDFRAAW